MTFLSPVYQNEHSSYTGENNVALYKGCVDVNNNRRFFSQVLYIAYWLRVYVQAQTTIIQKQQGAENAI